MRISSVVDSTRKEFSKGARFAPFMKNKLQRDYGRTELHFITFSCYRRRPSLNGAHSAQQLTDSRQLFVAPTATQLCVVGQPPLQCLAGCLLQQRQDFAARA
jgi:hypothetical protein